MNKKNLFILLTIILIVGIVLFSAWFFFFHPSAQEQTSAVNFNTGNSVSTTVSNSVSITGQLGTTIQNSQQKVFEIASGPIASATFIQTSNPTTTIARYVMQDSGHVLDQVINIPGAVSSAVSNTTIPGIATATWAEGGSAAFLQYLDGQTIKTIYLGFPPIATTTASNPTQLPVHIQFLPDNITSLATSPNGASVVYLLTTSTGVDGYVANVDGTDPQKLFSLALSQVLISWPAQGTLLAQSKNAAGVPGIAFSINAKSGAVSQLVYALGLSAIANPAFSKVVYQTADGATTPATYAHDVVSGRDLVLSFEPSPEKCAWDPANILIMYCAAPLSYITPNYLDLWHQGLINAPDALFGFNVATGATLAVTSPGDSDGVPASVIDQVAVSPDGNYLLYVTRGDRSLWGVHLSQ